MKRILSLFVMSVSILTISSCQKDNPTVDSPKDITCTVASTNVTTNGGHDGTITVTVLTGNGDYIYSINNTATNNDGLFTELSAGVYIVKVIDAENKTFEKSVTITQPDIVPVKPTVETSAATFITATTVTLNGKVNPNGFNTTLVKYEYGTSTSYGTTVTLTNVNGNTLTNVSTNLTNLTPNTLYHYRLVATNAGGTTNGSDMTFTTSVLAVAPTVTTNAATQITGTSVTLNGTVNPNGFNTTLVKFEYGTTTSYGTTVTLSNVNSLTNVNTDLTNLAPNTTYHYRLVATNAGGTTNGSDVQFSTLSIPIVVTTDVSELFSTKVKLNGYVNNGNFSSVFFEYGTTTSYGITSLSSNNVDATPNQVSIGAYITDLTYNTQYHYRLVGIKDGVRYEGNDMTFTTLDIKVGDALFGGTVFYLLVNSDTGYDPNRTHGYVVWNNDEPSANSYTWSESKFYSVTRNDKNWTTPNKNKLSILLSSPSYVNSILNSKNPNYTAMVGQWYWTTDEYQDIHTGTYYGVSIHINGTIVEMTPKTYDGYLRLITTF